LKRLTLFRQLVGCAIALGMLAPFTLACAQGIPGVSFVVERFEILGANPIDSDETSTILASFIGPHDGLERLLEASTVLEKSMRDRGHAFHRVILPPQTLEAGVVQLQILSFKVTSVRVEGNENFDEANIRASLPLIAVNAEPDTQKLSRAVRIANRHPAKLLKVGFADNKDGDGIEAKITVQDDKPWTVFAAVDNTGNKATGELRLALGGQYTNLFGLDHALTLSYTTSPQSPSKVRQKGLNYEIPLYGIASKLTFFYAGSDVDSGRISDLDISGAGRFLGARLRHELMRGDGFTHAITVGIDDKVFQSTVVPVGEGASLFPDVRTRPVSIEYSRDYDALWGNLGLSVTYARNIPSGAKNNGGAYVGNRLGTTVSWDVWRWRSYVDYAVDSGWLIRGSASGQWATELLVSGEQFGLGGARSIRGFGERVVSGDSGVRVGAELWTPPLESTVNARLVAFAEWGHVVTHRPPVGQDGDESVAGAGVGFRMQGAIWNAVGSVARVFDRAATANPGDVRAHFSVAWRY
jgi:hemolysin activation/secretion protein